MAQSPAPLVPEGIHSNAEGPPELCGFKGRDLRDLERRVMSDANFAEHQGDQEYRVFLNETVMVQFVFPKAGTSVFPMATCRKLFTDSSGGVSMTREMRCEGSREECDRVFLQFQNLDNKLTRETRGEQ